MILSSWCLADPDPTRAKLDAAAGRAVEGRQTGRYHLRLDAGTLRQAPPVPRVSTPELILPAGRPLHLRINCGMDLVDPGWQYRDEDGQLWVSDRPHRPGAQWGVIGGGAVVRGKKHLALGEPIELEGMYRAERYAASAYRFALPEDAYTVRLHFMETYDLDSARPGRRVFDIALSGKTVVERFDPVAHTGPARAIALEFSGLRPKEGVLEIGFTSRSDQPPIINGIEIIGSRPLKTEWAFERGDLSYVDASPSDLPPGPGPVVGRYLCGVGQRALKGYELVTPYANNAVWLPDVGATNGFWAECGGAGQRHGPITFSHAPALAVLRHERFGGKGYQIQVPRADWYAVRLHFAEGFEANYRPGMRTFDVAIEGHNVLVDFDAVKAGGGFAFASVFDVRGLRVTDGQLSVNLGQKVGRAILNAVEVFHDKDPPAELSVVQRVGPARREALLPASRPRTKIRVLYVGNSHTFFWAMPETVAATVNATPGAEVELITYRMLRGGRHLAWFVAQHERPDAPSALSLLEAGRYDAAVLQLLPNGDAEFNARMLRAVEAFADVADRIQTRLMLYVFNPLSRMDAESRKKLRALARERNMVIIPYGEARQALLASLSEAPLPLSIRGVGPHLGFHPAYLDVCLHAIAWTGKSPVGHPTPALVAQDVRVDAVRARWLQELAWRAYRRAKRKYDLRSWPEQY